MSSLSSLDHRARLFCAGVTACCIVFSAAPLAACGPFFPNQVIVNGDSGVLAMPVGDFIAEMDRLRPPGDPPFRAVVPTPKDTPSTLYEQTVRIDQSELESALTSAGVSAERRGIVLKDYRTAREQLAAQPNANQASATATVAGKGDAAPPVHQQLSVAVPAGLPAEFADYLSGAIAFHRGDMPSARAAWTTLLALPADQRRHRSTWAVFMLGKSYLDEDPAKAAQWFKHTRELAQGGFADTLGLASSSMGWEAKTELAGGRVATAMALYLQQHWTGDPTAAMSLRLCARNVFAAGKDTLNAAARDGLSRRVVTAYVLSDAGPFANLTEAERKRIPDWLAAVEAVAAKDVAGADRLAWAAYEQGQFDSASRWVKRAPADSPVAQWVRAKLLLRSGQIDSAAATLAKVVKSFPAESQWLNDPQAGCNGNGHVEIEDDEAMGGPVANIIPPVVGDLAVLQLARGQYVDAMDLLLRSDFWTDAAYIAERVLTPDELKRYVDRSATAPAAGQDAAVDKFVINSRRNQTAAPEALRYLLARRLTRIGKWKEARPYYPMELQKILDEYITAIRDGHDAHRSASERATALMLAARSAHDHGMELLGTELEPDFFCWGGSYGYGAATENDEPRGKGQKLTAPSDDELQRFKANAPEDQRRFHYRYIAAEHAWAAAALMPDDSDETAKLLNEAGGWIKERDPKSADRFYKALVLRCPSTALGKQAAALHWFPKSAQQ